MSTFLSTKWGPSILLQNCKRSLCGSICFPSTIVGNEECYKSTAYMFYSKQTWGDMGSDIQQGPTGRIWIPGGCSEDTATHHGAHTLPIVNRLHFSWWSKKFQSSKKSPGVFNAECSRTLFAGKQNTRSDTDAIHEKKKKTRIDPRFKALSILFFFCWHCYFSFGKFSFFLLNVRVDSAYVTPYSIVQYLWLCA